MLYQKGQVSVKVIDFGSSCYEHQKGKPILVPWSEFSYYNFFPLLKHHFSCEVTWVLAWAQPQQLLGMILNKVLHFSEPKSPHL